MLMVMVMERRLYPRTPIQLAAIITIEGGVRLEVVAVDISSDGLGIECNTKQRNMITPDGSFVHDGRPVSVTVDLNLADGEELVAHITAKCHVVFSRRESSERCKIGFHYVEIENDIYERLVRFIENRCSYTSTGQICGK